MFLEMITMRKVVSILLTLFLCILILDLSIGVCQIQIENCEIVQIPEGREITSGSNINVTILLSDITLIKSIQLVYCSLEPTFLCHFPPINLSLTAKGSFTAIFLPDYDVGTTFGYHLFLNYHNGSISKKPDGLEFSNNKINIQQGEDNEYYFELMMVAKTPTNTYETSWFAFHGIIILFIPFFIRKKAEKKIHFLKNLEKTLDLKNI